MANRWTTGNFPGTAAVYREVRWMLLMILLAVANACAIRSPEHQHSSAMQESVPKEPVRPPASVAQPPPERRRAPPDHSRRPAPRSWLANSGACLEPLEPVYQLGYRWPGIRGELNLDDDALVVLVTVPAFAQPQALSLHRRRTGVYFLRTTRLSSDEPPRTRERNVDFTTAQLLLKLWAALTERVQMVESDEASFDGKSHYFSMGPVTGYTANPRDGSVLKDTIFAANWLADLVRNPAREDPSDRHHIQEELREALARTTAKEACVRRVIE